jgi:hypothetical protein
MKEGHIVKCQPVIKHWHSSSTEHDVTYLALCGGDTPTKWTEEYTCEAYNEVAEKLAVSEKYI